MTRMDEQQTISPEMSEQAMFSTGSVIDGKWVLIERVGQGAMGEVYRAHQLNLKRDVALKLISQDLLNAMDENPDEFEGAVRRFQREVQAMAQVRHLNVLQIFDYGSIRVKRQDRMVPVEYIAMEYIPGNTLRFTMSEEGLADEPRLVAEWLQQYFLPLLDGVEAIHAHGIVHRDLKPENVLMDGETPKIADFGLARSLNLKAVSNSWDVKGTWPYMAPEQFADFRKAGFEADIYALGKILFEAVAGKMDPKTIPFKSVALPEAETPWLQDIDAIIRKATHENKQQRYGSTAEFRLAVLDVLTKWRTATVTIPASSPFPHSRWLWIGITSAIIAVLGMTAFHVYRWLSPPNQATVGGVVVKSRMGNGAQARVGPPPAELLAADGRTMVLMPAEGERPAFYTDRTAVTFHHYVEFLNRLATELSVSDGIVRKGEEIWLYLGSGSEPYEQIIFEHGQFHLRDAAWAARPVVRVTWLGAMAYAHHYGKNIPDLTQWQTVIKSGLVAAAPSADSVPSRSSDPHHLMMSGTDDGRITDSTPGGPADTKEWIDYIPSQASLDDQSGAVVVSHVADPQDPEMLNGRKPPLLRYPWEGFANVSFRTVLPLRADADKP